MTYLILGNDKSLSEEVAASISSKILYHSNEKIRCNEKYAIVKYSVQVKKTAIFRPDCRIDPVRYLGEFYINSCDLRVKELSQLSLKKATEIYIETMRTWIYEAAKIRKRKLHEGYFRMGCCACIRVSCVSVAMNSQLSEDTMEQVK